MQAQPRPSTPRGARARGLARRRSMTRASTRASAGTAASSPEQHVTSYPNGCIDAHARHRNAACRDFGPRCRLVTAQDSVTSSIKHATFALVTPARMARRRHAHARLHGHRADGGSGHHGRPRGAGGAEFHATHGRLARTPGNRGSTVHHLRTLRSHQARRERGDTNFPTTPAGCTTATTTQAWDCGWFVCRRYQPAMVRATLVKDYAPLSRPATSSRTGGHAASTSNSIAGVW